MQEKGITQSQLARLMKVSDARISQILNGDQNLTVRTLVKVGLAIDMRWSGFNLVPWNQIDRRADTTRRHEPVAVPETVNATPDASVSATFTWSGGQAAHKEWMRAVFEPGGDLVPTHEPDPGSIPSRPYKQAA
jgi:transcriptional regulator with XRE-family HTH domain